MRELAAKIESVNEQARLYNAAIAEFIAEASERIETLTAELAAKESEWTPITSVEQVEGLAAGFYIVLCSKGHGDGKPKVLIKTLEGYFSTVGIDLVVTDRTAENTHFLYSAYKLIRAFEPAAPSIPEGAIENTLENIEKCEEGIYLFVFDSKSGILVNDGTHELCWMADDYSDNEDVFDLGAKYFYKLDKEKAIAALEALAKGERNHEGIQ